MRLEVVGAWMLLSLAGCDRNASNEPDQALRAWLGAMERVNGQPEHAQSAYQLLSKGAQANLMERARRATDAAGRPIQPATMLVTSRFLLRFTPKTLTSRVAGDRAVVEVVGADGLTERAEVPMVREDGTWRVDIQLPSLPEIETGPKGHD